jgi:hypothetical protein
MGNSNVRRTFTEQRDALSRHKKSVEDEAPIWNEIAFKVKTGRIEPTAFTNDGIPIGAAYNEIAESYAWYTWRVGQILKNVADALEDTVRNYGNSEAVIVDDINAIGEQF